MTNASPAGGSSRKRRTTARNSDRSTGEGAQAWRGAPSAPAVDEDIAAGGEAGDERREADLGGVGLEVEHRFAVEEPAERDAVEAADQFALPGIPRRCAPRRGGAGRSRRRSSLR
jgi:hypothetical protein